MILLNVLGIVSFLFVAAFTFRAYMGKPTHGQSPRSSIIEAWINIGIGFSINYAANYLFLPMLGAHFSPMENFALGWIYTAISIIRQYAIRRWFNKRIHALASRI